jgi:hypothetical protein
MNNIQNLKYFLFGTLQDLNPWITISTYILIS